MGRALNWPFGRKTTAETMAAEVMIYSPATDAEALKLLRAGYSSYPLSARVAALDLLVRRRAREHGQRSTAR